MENSTIDKLAWINIKNGKILMVRTKGKDKFYNPGGKREGDENDVQALSRELKEELSVNVITSTAKLFQIYKAQADKKPEGVMVQMTCYTCDYEGDLKNANEIEEIAWLDSSNLDIISAVGKIIFEDLKLKKLID